MEKIQHWTHELPEGKRIFSTQVQVIDKLKDQIKNFCNQIEVVRSEIILLENELIEDAKLQYSQEEIETALYKYLIETNMELFDQIISIKKQKNEKDS